MNFTVLKFSKGKIKKINIPSIITTNLLIFGEKRKNLSQYFFYDYYKGNKSISRTQFIKYNFSQLINLDKSNFDKKNEIILDFSKTRKYKILSKKNYYLFDMDHLKYNNEFSIESFESVQSNDNNEIISLEEDENDNIIENQKSPIKYSNENYFIDGNIESILNSSGIWLEKNENKYDYLLLNSINSTFKDEENNLFFRKRISYNINKYYKNS